MTEEQRKFDYPADALRVARQLEGWSQREVAQRGGFTETAYGNWERGEVMPDPDMVLQLEQALPSFEVDWRRYAIQWSFKREPATEKRVAARMALAAMTATSVMGRYLWDLIYGRSSDVA